jgi:hypothetical protein
LVIIVFVVVISPVRLAFLLSAIPFIVAIIVVISPALVLVKVRFAKNKRAKNKGTNGCLNIIQNHGPEISRVKELEKRPALLQLKLVLL